MLGVLILLATVVAGMALAGRLARDQGRPQLPWVVVVLIAGLAGYLAGACLLALAFVGDSPLVLFAVFSGPVLAILFEALAIYCLYQLASGDLKLRRRDWPAYRIGAADSPAYECHLRLLDDAVSIESAAGLADPPLRLRFPEIRSVSVDGECLSIGWSDGHAVLRPGGAGMVSSARTRLSEALRREIARRVAPA